MRYPCFLLLLFTAWISPFLSFAQPDAKSLKPKVFVFTDINLVGGDPDDRQSFIHLLWYANELEIKGIVPDYWKGQGYEACLEGLETYISDYQKFNFAEKRLPQSGFNQSDNRPK